MRPIVVLPAQEILRLKSTHLHLLTALKVYDHGTGTCWPSLRTLAEATGMTLSKVQRVIREMVSLGYIAVEKIRKGSCNLYRIASRFLVKKFPKKGESQNRHRGVSSVTGGSPASGTEGISSKNPSEVRADARDLKNHVPIPDARCARLAEPLSAAKETTPVRPIGDAVSEIIKSLGGRPARQLVEDGRYLGADALKARKKEQRRQKVMRFVNATWPAHRADPWWSCMLSDDAAAVQKAFDIADAEMVAADWDDTPRDER